MTERPTPMITARSFAELPHTLVLAEVAVLCCISYAGAHAWIERGHLKARKASGSWLIEKEDLRRFVNKRGIVLTFFQSEHES